MRTAENHYCILVSICWGPPIYENHHIGYLGLLPHNSIWRAIRGTRGGSEKESMFRFVGLMGLREDWRMIQKKREVHGTGFQAIT